MNSKKIWQVWGDKISTTLLHPQYFIRRLEYLTVATVKKSAQGVVLDIGCGRQWYRPQIEPLVSRYYGLDSPRTSMRYTSPYPIELLNDATSITLPNHSVDLVFMIMVLEHLPDPEKAISEIYRVLKPQGKFVICTVENYPGHDLPYNYYHFTQPGLSQLLTRQGFTKIKIDSVGNFWETQVVFQNVAIMQWIKSFVQKSSTLWLGLLLLLLFTPIMVGGNVLALIIGQRKKSLEFALGHLLVASKKAMRA